MTWIARRGDHSSRSRIAPRLKQPTRGLSSLRSYEQNAYGPGQPSPPIWPCSTRGFPCPGCCHPGGGLLPHLFTLAKCARPNEASFRFSESPPPRSAHHRRSRLCGTFRSRALERLVPKRNSLALPGALPSWPALFELATVESGLSSGSPLLALRPIQGEQAITRPIRQPHYNPAARPRAR
jgi:hypothetical protein